MEDHAGEFSRAEESAIPVLPSQKAGVAVFLISRTLWQAETTMLNITDPTLPHPPWVKIELTLDR